MEKCWYVLINSKKEGPFSLLDLRRDDRITPDTLVWKEGFSTWIPARHVPELKALFEEEHPEDSTQEEEESLQISRQFPQEEIALNTQRDPSFWFWILIILIIFTYACMQLIRK